MRQQQIYKIIKFNKPKTIVEVGTYNGVMALHYITWAAKFSPGEKIVYYGFDLFEDATDEIDDLEFNAKREHASKAQVEHIISNYRTKEGMDFEFHLIKGNTRDTLQGIGPWQSADLAIIDGGHSLETIKNDYEALKDCKVVIFDDYYEEDESKACPDITKYGCNKLVKDLPSAVILSMADTVAGGGRVRMVMTPVQYNPYPVNIQVKTQNCIPDDQIKENIEYSTRKPRRFVKHCKTHDKTAIIVAAGPSFMDDIDEIRELSLDPQNHIYCVKSNYTKIIENGVKVFGCTLLDPRAHVSAFIDKIYDDVTFFVATMCDQSTVDYVEKAKNVLFWNALVGAGETDYIAKLVEEEKRPISIDMVRGGSTAAMRTISLASVLGYKKVILYGFDCCFWEPQNMEHKDDKGQAYFWRVAVGDQTYLTSLQLFSQSQEFAQLLSCMRDIRAIDIEVRGKGMIKKIYDMNKPEFMDLEELVHGQTEELATT